MEINWKTLPTVHYYNTCAKVWTSVHFATQQAAHDYYQKLARLHMTVKLVYGTVEYH